MRRRPFLFIGIAAFLSTLLCSLIPYREGVAVVLIAALFLFAVSFLKWVPLSPRLAMVIGFGAIAVSCGFASQMIDNVEPQLALDGTTASVTVCVEQRLSSSNAYIVRVEDGDLQRGTRLCFWTGHRAFAVKCGDRLTSEVELIAAYDKEREEGNFAKANGVFLYAWPTDNAPVIWEDGQDRTPFWEGLLYRLREAIHNTLYRRMSHDGAAMSEGMLLGNCGNIAAADMRAFHTCGVYHLLAVSGGHLSIIMAALLKIGETIGLSRRLRAVMTMAAIVLFMALCGFVDSINRSGVSALLMLGGMLVSRRSDGLNSLGLAATALLLIDPFCIYDLGWQLSFAATGGLLSFMPLWEREIDQRLATAMPRLSAVIVPISTAVGVTVSATVFTLPLTMVYSGEISTVSILANLICVPLSTVLLALNFLSVLSAWCAPLSLGLFAVAEWVCDALTVSTRFLATLPFAVVTANEPWLWGWFAATVIAVAVGYVICRMGGVWRASAVMMAILIIGCAVYESFNRDVSHITVAPSDQTAVAIQTGDTFGLIVAAHGEALEESLVLADNAHIKTVDWLLWLGKSCDQAVNLADFDLPVERLVVTAPRDAFAVLPSARTTTVFSDGDVLCIGEDCFLESCAGFWRVSVGDTTCLIASEIGASASRLKADWRQNTLCLMGAVPLSHERLKASKTVFIAKHNTCEEWQKQIPDALAAVEYDTLRFSTRGDGNITLRE